MFAETSLKHLLCAGTVLESWVHPPAIAHNQGELGGQDPPNTAATGCRGGQTLMTWERGVLMPLDDDILKAPVAVLGTFPDPINFSPRPQEDPQLLSVALNICT